MSFSDQQGCPQNFNIRPIDLHYVFSVFPSQNLPKAAFMPCLAKRFSMLRMTYPCPCPSITPQQLEDGGVFLPKWRAEGNSEFPRSTCQVARIPKKGKVFFFVSSNHPTGGRCDRWDFFNGICAIIPWQNMNIGDSWHQLELVSQISAWKKWVSQRGLWPTYNQDVFLGCPWKWS